MSTRFPRCASRFGMTLLLASCARAWYDNDACCVLAQTENAFLDILPQDAICGQSYSLLANNTPSSPAPDAHVSWSFCHANCPGWGRSQARSPGQWAAPIVQFILPSVIFALTIPRTRELDTRSAWVYTKTIQFLAPLPVDELTSRTGLRRLWDAIRAVWHWLLKAFVIDALLILADTILWILVIISFAGPMLVEGLFEALLDFRILHYVQQHRNKEINDVKPPQVGLLLTVVVGNLELDGAHPHDKLSSALLYAGRRQSAYGIADSHVAVKTRLLSMLGTQSIFGATVGAPVLFYLGAFFYTILDLMNNPSDQDSAISLAFGIEWMIVVHVAIVAGCLLANNNPNTSAAIVGLQSTKQSSMSNDDHFRVVKKLIGWSKSYETIFQPVQMWHRGSNKMKWLRRSEAWQTCTEGEGIKKKVGVLKWYWLFMLAILFVMLPSVAGAAVAYATPPVGFGCRSLSFICYAGCQFILIVKAIAELDSEPGSLWHFVEFLAEPWDWVCFEAGRLWQHITWPYRAVPGGGRRVLDFVFTTIPFFIVPIIGSLFTGIGGTLMQVIGVYRTCFCYINAPFWLDLDSSPGVNLASDNQGQRISSQNWVWAGATATVFMAVACYLGYAYQESLRYSFTVEVEHLFPEITTATSGAGQGAAGQPANPLQRFGGGGTATIGQSMNNGQDPTHVDNKPNGDIGVSFVIGNHEHGRHVAGRTNYSPSKFYTHDAYNNNTSAHDLESHGGDFEDQDPPREFLRRRSTQHHGIPPNGDGLELDSLLPPDK